MQHWYDPQHLPDGALRVRVWWMAHGTPRQFDAARIATKGRWQWWTLSPARKAVQLPPPGREQAAWVSGPLCWQPMDGNWRWPHRAPAPLAPHMVPRLVGEKVRFDAVEAASSAELASEMHRDRQDARRGRTEIDQSVDTYRRWWRDPFLIKYQPKGAVTRDMAEGRVMRAMAWAGAYNLMAPVTLVTADVLAAYAADDMAVMVADDSQVVKFEPLQQDHGDFETAMGWVVALNPPERWSADRIAWSLSPQQRVLYWRARNTPLSYQDIAQALARGRERQRSWQAIQATYERAIDNVWRAANGRSVYGIPAGIDRLEKVRAANREHRNSP